MNNDTLEGYLMALGKLAIMIKMLGEEQSHYVRSGILNDDEAELSQTIKWHCDKLMISMDDQVRAVGERTAKPWEETLEDIKKQLTQKGKNGTNNRAKNKSKRAKSKSK